MNNQASRANIVVTVKGDVPQDMVSYAETKIGHAISNIPEPILAVHVVLSVAMDPAVERPAQAEASLNLNGTPIRARAATPDMSSTIDLLEERLQRNLDQYHDRLRTQRRRVGLVTDTEWRHGALPSQRKDYYPRPPEDRKIVRRKTISVAPVTAEEAAYDMDLLDHDFYLFTNQATGRDALVFRDQASSALLGQALTNPQAGQVYVAETAPTLAEAEAISRLDVSGEPFVFYLDATTGRGNVLYMRYDGHYGLITAVS